MVACVAIITGLEPIEVGLQRTNTSEMLVKTRVHSGVCIQAASGRRLKPLSFLPAEIGTAGDVGQRRRALNLARSAAEHAHVAGC